jgi:hypothetical protein
VVVDDTDNMLNASQPQLSQPEIMDSTAPSSITNVSFHSPTEAPLIKETIRSRTAREKSQVREKPTKRERNRLEQDRPRIHHEFPKQKFVEAVSKGSGHHVEPSISTNSCPIPSTVASVPQNPLVPTTTESTLETPSPFLTASTGLGSSPLVQLARPSLKPIPHSAPPGLVPLQSNHAGQTSTTFENSSIGLGGLGLLGNSMGNSVLDPFDDTLSLGLGLGDLRGLGLSSTSTMQSNVRQPWLTLFGNEPENENDNFLHGVLDDLLLSPAPVQESMPCYYPPLLPLLTTTTASTPVREQQKPLLVSDLSPLAPVFLPSKLLSSDFISGDNDDEFEKHWGKK